MEAILGHPGAAGALDVLTCAGLEDELRGWLWAIAELERSGQRLREQRGVSISGAALSTFGSITL
jgi:hypothetical protein